ncbi:MAG TPA: dTDP-4-dehydrorhamnose 3,5-epimerase [Acidiferrobacterales bacterium]
MSLIVEDLPLTGLKLIKPQVFSDARGYFLEIHQTHKLKDAGFSEAFVQDNLSWSRRGVLRGLHYQFPNWQGKLVTCLQGEIFDVAVDVRRDSPSFGRWHGLRLSEANHHQLYVPEGFAHGFCVLSQTAQVLYKVTGFYRPEQEHTILWNDPALAIAWPVTEPLLSAKDAQGKPFREAVIPG